MKRLFIFVALVIAASPAFAISRYNSESMTCQDAKNVIRRDGAAILTYRSDRVPNLVLFDRYVTDTDHCDADRYAKQEYIPTSDTKHCVVLACAQRSDDGAFDR